MKQLLIIYHSQTGNTEKLAYAALVGAQQEEDTYTRIIPAFDATLEHLRQCDGILFGSAENFGYMSGAIKDFFDRTYYPAQAYQLNLPYAIFISASNDGSNAVRQMDRILSGYPMRSVLAPVIIRGEINQEGVDRAHELGHGFAAGLALGIF